MQVTPVNFGHPRFSCFENFILRTQYRILRSIGCIFPTLEEIDRLCRSLHTQISKDFTPDLIVGIATGGHYAAQRLAALFHAPYHEIYIARDYHHFNNLILSDLIGYGKLFPRRRLALQKPFTVNIQGLNILLVDDEYGTEATFTLASDVLFARGAKEIQKTALVERHQAPVPDITAALRQTPVSRYIKSRIRLPWDQYSPYYRSFLEWRAEQPHKHDGSP